MTRKHFIALAYALRYTKPDVSNPDDLEAYIQWEKVCCAVGEACRKFNANFNFTKFIDACEGR